MVDVEQMRKRKKDILRETERGNVLALTTIVFGILFLVLIVGLIVSVLFYSQKRVQNQSDRLALVMAEKLNEYDRIGEINNMVERARELVFTSRQTHSDVNERFEHIEPLAKQLLEEARQGAIRIEQERKAISDAGFAELKDEVKQANKSLAQQAQVNVPWLRTYPATVFNLEAGYIQDVDSNALQPEGLPALLGHDTERRYINGLSKLYRANINAKLPSPDNDLNFKFASLPAPVKGTVAPARLVLHPAFHYTMRVVDKENLVGGSTDQIPSAVKLDLVSSVSTQPDGRKEREFSVAAAAATTGALPPP